MKEVKVLFSNADISCTVVLPNGSEKSFVQVSAMINWCAENGYEPIVTE